MGGVISRNRGEMIVQSLAIRQGLSDSAWVKWGLDKCTSNIYIDGKLKSTTSKTQSQTKMVCMEIEARKPIQF